MIVAQAIRTAVAVTALATGLFLFTSTVAQEILPGPQLNGAWLNTNTPGQGLLVDVNPSLNMLLGLVIVIRAVHRLQPGRADFRFR